MNDMATAYTELTLATIIENLREAARYARTHPKEAEDLADFAHSQFVPPIKWPEEWMAYRASQLMSNIGVGIRVIHANPDMLASYCRCAADELTMWADRMRREREEESEAESR